MAPEFSNKGVTINPSPLGVLHVEQSVVVYTGPQPCIGRAISYRKRSFGEIKRLDDDGALIEYNDFYGPRLQRFWQRTQLLDDDGSPYLDSVYFRTIEQDNNDRGAERALVLMEDEGIHLGSHSRLRSDQLIALGETVIKHSAFTGPTHHADGCLARLSTTGECNCRTDGGWK